MMGSNKAVQDFSEHEQLNVEVSDKGVIHIKPSDLVNLKSFKEQMAVLDSIVDEGLINFDK